MSHQDQDYFIDEHDLMTHDFMTNFRSESLLISHVPFTIFQNCAANVEAGAEPNINGPLIMVLMPILANEFRLFFADDGRL